RKTENTENTERRRRKNYAKGAKEIPNWFIKMQALVIPACAGMTTFRALSCLKNKSTLYQT
ncbi:MAG: hypothetical protein KA994_03310, partial [Brachymonas sp.]|nr:hypothetical protein [Brachymonas sp.]